MQSCGKGSLSATTQVHPVRYLFDRVGPVGLLLSNRVKVLIPEIILIALGQGFHFRKLISGHTLKVSVCLTCRGLSPWRADELFILELGRPYKLHTVVKRGTCRLRQLTHTQ